jgi:glycosyltransferase involved in cell wall biosynthesis
MDLSQEQVCVGKMLDHLVGHDRSDAGVIDRQGLVQVGQNHVDAPLPCQVGALGNRFDAPDSLGSSRRRELDRPRPIVTTQIEQVAGRRHVVQRAIDVHEVQRIGRLEHLQCGVAEPRAHKSRHAATIQFPRRRMHEQRKPREPPVDAISEVPLVTVIVPTRNSERFLARCLTSIRNQTYRNIELIVVDNGSTDATVTIAQDYADAVMTAGPERSAQVNRAAEAARGRFIYRVDSDFELAPTVVEECVATALQGHDAVVVHNSPDVAAGRLARIRKFEVDMYKFDLAHSAARFVDAELFRRIGGYDEAITAGEDYDFQNRLTAAGATTGFVDSEATHLDEPTSIFPHLRKYFLYGRDLRNFVELNGQTAQLSFVRSTYVRNWRRFASHPIVGLQFVAYHCAKFAAGAGGYADAVIRASLASRRIANGSGGDGRDS